MTDCDPYVFTSTLIRSCIDYAVVGDCNHPLSSRSAEQRSVPMIGAASHKKKNVEYPSWLVASIPVCWPGSDEQLHQCSQSHTGRDARGAGFCLHRWRTAGERLCLEQFVVYHSLSILRVS